MRGTGLLLSTLMVLAAAGAAAEPSAAELHRLRAERRAALRAQSAAVDARRALDKSAAAGRFAVLVIPVDFVDARLPADWTDHALAARLVPDEGETLHNYFRIASGGRLDLDLILAPLVRLPDTRRQYSDRDLNGFTRTRRLATEALTAVREHGLAFRRLDNDGPDGLAGTADDDGEVDGVLILHAGIGQENDPAGGLIQPLQFFLEEPVRHGGVVAAFYAVASLHSGPGIWAHETAHLLGLEDRYDPLLHPAGGSEVQSRGGLGDFSLMGSGAWGTGSGWGAALPDAYSAVQVGWYAVRHLGHTAGRPDSLRSALVTGEVARVWGRGVEGPEFFLLETRDPVRAAPFDAAVPGPGQLVAYHIDETVAEGAWQEDGPYMWHLRARLVEADGNGNLAGGVDSGTPADVFPGETGNTRWSPYTIPSTASYASGATGVTIDAITSLSDGVTFSVALDTDPSLTFDSAFVADSLCLVARETGTPFTALRVVVTAESVPAHGQFAATGNGSIELPLIETAPGRWEPADAPAWLPATVVPPGARTRFRYRFADGTFVYLQDLRTWVWREDAAALDFRGPWPGAWTIAHPTGNTGTTWHRWDAVPWSGGTGPVLTCVGSAFTDGALWPDVLYGNGAHTTLTSGLLGDGVGAVRLVHAIEVEMLTGTTGMDGGFAVWLGPDGAEIPATPLEGYDGRIATGSSAVRHGRPAFVGGDLESPVGPPLWRVATLPVPNDRPGPWRLRLDFSANTLWRARGWYVANVEAVAAGEEPAGFAAVWDGDLSWAWPWAGGEPVVFVVQARPGPDASWQEIVMDSSVPDAAGICRLPGDRLLAALPGGAATRHEVRVIGPGPVGEVATGPVAIYADGGAAATGILGDPWPNPSTGEVRFLLDVPSGRTAVLKIYDVRGRLVRTVRYGTGRRLVAWDGRGDGGLRVAAGLYFLRLEGTGPVLTRKVVLLH